jgi:MFS family permease
MNLFAVTIASFIACAGLTLVMPFLPLYFRELGVRDLGELALWSGLSLAATPALTALLAPFWGRLADRYGRKIMLERTLVSFAIVMAATAYATRPWHVLALRVVQGLFAGYGALGITMAADSSRRERLASSIGMVQTAQRIGPAVGPVIGGLVALWVGSRRAFLVAAAFYVVALLIVMVLYRERSQPKFSGSTEVAHLSRLGLSFRRFMTFENFVLMMTVIFGIQFVDRSLFLILPLYIGELGLPLERVPIVSGWLFSLMAGSGALGHHLCAPLLKTVSTRFLITAGATAAGLALFVVSLSPQVGQLMAAMLVLGLATGASTTAAYTAAGGVVPAGGHGTGFGFLASASLLGMALSPVVSAGLASMSIRAMLSFDAFALFVLAALVSRVMITTPFRAEQQPMNEA